MRYPIVQSFVLACLVTSGAAANEDSPAMTRTSQELQVLRIVDTTEVRSAMEQAKKLFFEDAVAETPQGLATLADAAMQHAYSAVQCVINLDPHHPMISSVTQYAHRVGAQSLPSALHGGLENPDNIHRLIPVSADSRYVLHGQRHQPGPAQVTYELRTTVPGLRNYGGYGPVAPRIENDAEMGEQISMLEDRDMKIAKDGYFTITLDSDPPGGRDNHIHLTPEAKVLFVRDTLSDWATQTPDTLRIERVAGPETPPKTESELVEDAAEIVVSFTQFWLGLKYDQYRRNPDAYKVNEVVPARGRTGGWGYIVNTRYAVTDDEGLIVTTDPMEARYYGIMLGNTWWIAMEASRHNGSFNRSQAEPNPDGSYTYVIANRDPGVYNWLDTGGVHNGIIQIRWQGIPASMNSVKGALREVRLVKLADLADTLPKYTKWVTADEREAQLDARFASYRRRLP